MTNFEPHSGEGAVSTGPMVVLHDAKSVSEARAIVALLEAHQIPALVNHELDGIVFPWQPPAKPDAASVLVPSQMLSSARDILRKGVGDRRRVIPFPAERRGPPPAPQVRPPTPPPAPPAEAEASAEDQLELELPAPPPLLPRVITALAAVAFGIGMQRLLEALLSPAGVLADLGVRAPVWVEPYRLVIAGFLHMSLEHFASNAVFGLVLGVVLFGTHRAGATALVWLLSSMLGLATEAALTPGLVVVAGASAGNYGLVGLWAKGQLDRSRVAWLSRREIFRTLGILALMVPGALTPITSSGSRVAVLAHLGGFLAGFLLGIPFRRRLLPEGFASIGRRSSWAGAAAAGLVVGALGWALVILVH